MRPHAAVDVAAPLSVSNSRPIEALSTSTPLGLQFWDFLTDAPITRPLHVVALPWPAGGRPVVAFPARRGVYSFRGLPGLRATEFPAATAGTVPVGWTAGAVESFPASLPDDGDVGPGLFAVTVDDPIGQFSPLTLVVTAPHRGLVTTADLVRDSQSLPEASLPDGSFPDASSPIYLSSSPTRALPTGTAAMRAQLVPIDGTSSHHAVLQVDVRLPDGTTTRHVGCADANGSVLVAFPYPPFPIGVEPSPPPGTPGLPPDTQRWDLAIRVLREPAALVRVPGIETPTLTSMFAQAPTSIWRGTQLPALALSTQLRYGSELVLATEDHDRPELLIGDTSP